MVYDMIGRSRKYIVEQGTRNRHGLQKSLINAVRELLRARVISDEVVRVMICDMVQWNPFV